MMPRRRLLTGAVLLLFLLLFGVVGYVLVEGWSFLDALYMTVITVTTVGFEEVQPLGTGGRIFTIFLVLLGVGVAFYILTTVVATVVEGELGLALGVRRMMSRIEALRDHHILCGFGRVGEEIARQFGERGAEFVIVESREESIERARAKGYLIVEGDATQDESLLRAGIRRARALLAASDSDSGNTYIILAAKGLNPDVFLVARAGQPSSEPRMLGAGADRVISPYRFGGRRMALSVLQPLTVDFIDTLAAGQPGERILAEVAVTAESPLLGRSVSDVLEICPRATVLGIQKASGAMAVGPGGAVSLELGDRLMVLAREEEVAVLGRPATPAEGSGGQESPTPAEQT
jgi:voltage-gated potassium channel